LATITGSDQSARYAGWRLADRVFSVMAMTARTLVLKYLIGRFPATRDELVDRAQRQGADQRVVALVRHLDGERFESAADLVRALGHEHRAEH
jgi:Protein of unknown function (DUF2795)